MRTLKNTFLRVYGITPFFMCMTDAETAPAKRKNPTASYYFDLDMKVLSNAHISADHRKLLGYWHGAELQQNVNIGKPNPKKLAYVTSFDVDNPRGEKPLVPSEKSPLCQKCKLYTMEASHPYMGYKGPEDPLVSIIYEGVSRTEDTKGELATGGNAWYILRYLRTMFGRLGVTEDQLRWIPITRCSPKVGKMPDLKSRANWCRHHVIDDLMRHPPKVIIPVGSMVLGMLSHKSNAEYWSGKLLTYRGWPDDWLTDPKYALERPDPRDHEKKVIGHPVFGPIPSIRIPMVPVQRPNLVSAAQNDIITKRWRKHLLTAFKYAVEGITANDYMRPWYRFTEDIQLIEEALHEICSHPGLLVCYDTETTGIRPWGDGAAVVSMMFRWLDPVDGQPRSIGFPWNFETSGVRPYIKRLQPLVWKALTQSKLVGHNITFDVLYTYATFWKHFFPQWDDSEGAKRWTNPHRLWDDPDFNRKRDGWLTSLADAGVYDTWHMAYVTKQARGTFGLEAVAYEYVPDLAGYEEEMTLLINLHYETMHPEAGKGGHYLNCPRDKWETHLTPYVMGDVEVCHRAFDKIEEKLKSVPVYKMPLAKPDMPGRFRYFQPPSRAWVYDKIMSPASRVLMKLMGRGMFVDYKALKHLEATMPEEINDLRKKLREINPRIEDWCRIREEEAQGKGEPKWELDLENKGQLKELLFGQNVLNLPPQRLTKEGRKIYGENPAEWRGKISEALALKLGNASEYDMEKAVDTELLKFTATDKYTLNRLAVDHPDIRPLLDYRKVHKLYSTYVRPLRNIQTAGIDKKARTKDKHLCYDGCIHASFLLTGTRGGRLSCQNPNLQQLPRDGAVKQMFVSRFGARGCLYQGDLSQIELRLMACCCGDPTMVQAYFDDTDLHSLTASRIFNTPYEHFTKDYMKSLQSKGKDKEAKQLDENRNISKTVNFLTGYGGGAFGLQNVLAAKSIYKPIEFCEDIIHNFFEAYPSLKMMLQYYKKFIEDNEVAVSIFGRVRIFEEVRSNDMELKSKALRAGCNHLIQSTASDMMLVALIVIEDMMREQGLESILVSTVHDSLLIDAVREELPQIHDIVTTVLNNFDQVLPAFFGEYYDTSWMIVPFTGDCEVGINYLKAKKIPKKDVDWDELLRSA